MAGDGNGDGILDSAPPQVTSFSVLATPNPVSNPDAVNSTFITLVAHSLAGKIDSSTSIATINHIAQLDAPATKPAILVMPAGLLNFTASVTTPGGRETFSIYWDTSTAAVNGFWLLGQDEVWFNLANDAFEGEVAQEGNKSRLDFVLADGGTFDADGKADGFVTCIGGLGQMPLSLVGQPSSEPPAGTTWF
jgi:hypothetical protein